jgi:hypothetical protein
MLAAAREYLPCWLKRLGITPSSNQVIRIYAVASVAMSHPEFEPEHLLSPIVSEASNGGRTYYQKYLSTSQPPTFTPVGIQIF